MKHSKEDYETCHYYEPSEDEIRYSCKVVKVRKQHYCIASDEKKHYIDAGQMALVERAIIPGAGRRSAYTCLPCLDDWIDHIKKIEELQNANP